MIFDADLTIILFLSVVAPIWIICHYVTKNKKSAGITPEQAEKIDRLNADIDKMQSRIDSLEELLDESAPDWRKQS